MEIKLKQQEQPLLSLTKVEGTLTFKGKTPSYEALLTEIAKKTKAKVELIQIKHIYTDFKSESGNFIANIYKDEATFNKFLTKTEKAAIKKQKEEAAKKLAEEKKAAAEEAKKAEEAKAAENQGE